jgi:hypothetical protein
MARWKDHQLGPINQMTIESDDIRKFCALKNENPISGGHRAVDDTGAAIRTELEVDISKRAPRVSPRRLRWARLQIDDLGNSNRIYIPIES